MAQRQIGLSVWTRICLLLAAFIACFWGISACILSLNSLCYRPRIILYFLYSILSLMTAGTFLSLFESLTGCFKPVWVVVKCLFLLLLAYGFFLVSLFDADRDAGRVEYGGKAYVMVDCSILARESYKYYGYVNGIVMGEEILMYWYDWEDPHTSLGFPVFPE